MSAEQRQSYEDCVDTAPGHLLFCLPKMAVWNGVPGFWCLHAAVFDGTDWAVTVCEQDHIGYMRWRTKAGGEPTAPRQRAESRCLHLPGTVVGHVVYDDEDTPAAFTQEAAFEVFALVSRTLWAAVLLAGDARAPFDPPLPVSPPASVPSGTRRALRITAIEQSRRRETLAEAMRDLTEDDISGFIDDFLDGLDQSE